MKALKLPGIYFLEEHRRSYPRGDARRECRRLRRRRRRRPRPESSTRSTRTCAAAPDASRCCATRGAACTSSAARERTGPIDGNDVVLTIDSVVQFIAERALAKAVDKYRRRRRRRRS